MDLVLEEDFVDVFARMLQTLQLEDLWQASVESAAANPAASDPQIMLDGFLESCCAAQSTDNSGPGECLVPDCFQTLCVTLPLLLCKIFHM
jgi:hypothetical protein